ncbi:hypothetical protein A2153_03055 [Candidatus Gottesmanbacteria bacterium RBG_16_38_7b]|uniref:Glycosyl hydrolase family 98 putative carbohydrate-binding module domain-containing protein n=1 Tax=Candidatus Gottesmanbacteria bacterium RBG_16_38_7b TaxID=1798372 RepID=A0A1F5YIX6_9BACT|nr:MAG: hypothetical protein A2153_03055 [Candidatus Gottesmanbacteria bacterium RBG_16_38_7b]
MKKAFLLVLFVGLIIRILLVGNPGFEADISFWKSWGLAAIDHGIVWTSLNTNINYPPGFIYILYLMTKIYSLFADPHDYYNFWQLNNFWFLLASKSIAIVFDTIIAALIYWFFSQTEKLKQLGANLQTTNDQRPKTNTLPLILATIFYLNPVVIIDSALWGQVESLGIFFTLAAIILLFYRKPLLATAIFAVGPMLKLQNIIFIPIYFIFLGRFFDYRTVIKSTAVAVTVFFITVLPFIFAQQMNQVLFLLTVNSDYFPWLSLNAHNLWWIVARARGMETTDKITVLGIMNAKRLGLLLFSSSYLLSCLLTYLKPTARNLLLSLTFAIFSFFLLTTQSHERYSYPVVILLLFLYPFLSNALRPKTKVYFWFLYSLFTLNIFFNIHTGLIFNYPNNGWNLLTSITSRGLTLINSYFSILLYFLLYPFLFSQISFLFFPLAITLLIALISLSHASYYLKGRVSLTSFRPIIVRQDFESLQVNKAVNSATGWKKWNRLSNNYFFYRRGFGTHAISNLTFDINRRFSSFATDIGVDTEASTDASVVFQIWGDGRKLFESRKMGRFDFPQSIKVNISGVKFLGLIVTDAGDGINSDHADWLNPVLYK